LALRWASERTSEATTAKPPAGLAGPGRLDGGVERQDVGLEGQAIDHGDDLAHLLTGGGDVLHGVDGRLHALAPGLASGAHLAKQGVHLAT
jgi:hypothetical protein